MFCLEPVEHFVGEGEGSLSLDVELKCGKVGEFTVSMNATTSDSGTAAGNVTTSN